MAITLQANKFIGTLSNLIGQTYVMNFFQTQELDDVIDTFKKGNIAYGNGEVVYSVSVPEVKDLDITQTSLLTYTAPSITEEYIPISEYKVIPITINNYLLQNAFLNENAMSVLVSYILMSMDVAKKVHVRNAILGSLNTAIAGTSVSAISITGKEVTADMSGLDANATRTYNTNAIYRTLKSAVKNIALGKGNGTNEGKYVTSDDLVALINASTYASLEVDTLATLLKSDKATANIRMVVIADDDASNIGDGVVAILQKSALRFGFFYEVATAFFDASNLNTNHWLHFSYYNKFVATGVYQKIVCTNFSVE